ncbi:hypothetical protein ACOSP7_021248 [Xanthoceras sorbifolium]
MKIDLQDEKNESGEDEFNVKEFARRMKIYEENPSSKGICKMNEDGFVRKKISLGRIDGWLAASCREQSRSELTRDHDLASPELTRGVTGASRDDKAVQLTGDNAAGDRSKTY